MTVTVRLTPETEHCLREKAARQGQTLETYLEHLAEAEARPDNGTALPLAPAPPLGEFDRQLDEFSEGLPTLSPLPADFARADLYADHD